MKNDLGKVPGILFGIAIAHVLSFTQLRVIIRCNGFHLCINRERCNNYRMIYGNPLIHLTLANISFMIRAFLQTVSFLFVRLLACLNLISVM